MYIYCIILDITYIIDIIYRYIKSRICIYIYIKKRHLTITLLFDRFFKGNLNITVLLDRLFQGNLA